MKQESNSLPLPLVLTEEGQNAVVAESTSSLSAIGFAPGERVSLVMRAPLGDPCAYRVRGVVIGLRRADASAVRAFAAGVTGESAEREARP